MDSIPEDYESYVFLLLTWIIQPSLPPTSTSGPDYQIYYHHTLPYSSKLMYYITEGQRQQIEPFLQSIGIEYETGALCNEEDQKSFLEHILINKQKNASKISEGITCYYGNVLIQDEPHYWEMQQPPIYQQNYN